MAKVEPGMESMLEMYIFETNTLLEQLDEILLRTEDANVFSQEDINEIFRIMHTIKGSSAMMGFENLQHLAHKGEDMLGRIFDGISLTEFWLFLVGLPVSFLLFGVIFGAVSSKGKLRTDEALYEAKNGKMRFAPPALVCAFTAPILIVYVLFFFSQLGYFISAFGGVLPDGYSYSGYARQGFFELCGVAVL